MCCPRASKSREHSPVVGGVFVFVFAGVLCFRRPRCFLRLRSVAEPYFDRCACFVSQSVPTLRFKRNVLPCVVESTSVNNNSAPQPIVQCSVMYSAKKGVCWNPRSEMGVEWCGERPGPGGGERRFGFGSVGRSLTVVTLLPPSHYR